MEKWKRDWFKEINTRVLARSSYPTEGVSNDDVFAQGFLIGRRHAHADPNQNDGSNENDRNFRPSWNQPCIEKRPIPECGQRLFFLAGPRGLGKGHIFNGLTTAWC